MQPFLFRAVSRFIAEVPDVLLGRKETSPIRIEGKPPTVVCIHGFTGVPREVGLACEVARRLGLAADAPLLPGHGTSTTDLGACDYADWLSGAQVAFDRARERGPVILVGLSLGSLLATELCIQAPGDVLGLALLSNAFWLHAPYPRLALEAAARLGVPNLGFKKGASDIGDREALKSHVSYSVQPLHAALEVLRAGKRLRKELDRVHRPTLILHGARDRVCPVSNAWRVAERLGTSDSKVVIFPRSHHILTGDSEREQVGAELENFFTRCLRPS